jgi:hypothetical protein
MSNFFEVQTGFFVNLDKPEMVNTRFVWVVTYKEKPDGWKLDKPYISEQEAHEFALKVGGEVSELSLAVRLNGVDEYVVTGNAHEKMDELRRKLGC